MFDAESPEPPHTVALVAMPFPERLAAIRKERHLTQQALANHAELHVSMIRKYETGAGQPNLDALKRLAVALSVPTDLLVFDQDERGPGDDLRLQFEATLRLSADERKVVREVLDAIVLKHEAKRWASSG